MHPLLPVPQFKLKTTNTVHQQLHEGICLLHFKGFCCESNFPFVHSHDRRVIYPFKPFFAQEVVGLIMSCSGISIIRSRIVGVDVLPCLSLSLYHHDRYQRGISHTIGTTWLLCLINISLTWHAISYLIVDFIGSEYIVSALLRIIWPSAGN